MHICQALALGDVVLVGGIIAEEGDQDLLGGLAGGDIHPVGYP